MWLLGSSDAGKETIPGSCRDKKSNWMSPFCLVKATRPPPSLLGGGVGGWRQGGTEEACWWLINSPAPQGDDTEAEMNSLDIRGGGAYPFTFSCLELCLRPSALSQLWLRPPAGSCLPASVSRVLC